MAPTRTVYAKPTQEPSVAVFLFPNATLESIATTTSVDEEATVSWCIGYEPSWHLSSQGSTEVVRTSDDVSTSTSNPRVLTESDFRLLATRSPLRLLWLIRYGNLRPSQLTFAAEIAGSISDTTVVVPALLELLKHPSALVREGAIYGLSQHLSDEVRRRLARVAQTDPSPAVRSAAHDAIE